jgi:hypothetical protein
MKTLSTMEICEQLKETVANGSDACLWLGHAYLSWYRGSHLIDLNGFESLDPHNRLLFNQMLTLRSRPQWNDQILYELEKELIRLIGPSIKKPEKSNNRQRPT